MQNSLFRTGYSTIIRESQDASCAILNRHGEVVAQHVVLAAAHGRVSGLRGGNSEKLHAPTKFMKATPSSPIIPISAAVRTRRTWRCCRRFSITANGSASPRISRTRATSAARCRAVAGARRARFTRKACTFRRSNTFHGYQTSKDIEAVLGANSRTPELVVGDLRGQVGAARLGERRFQEMMERYGKETILTSFEQLFALTEAKVRAEIASWPDGVGEGERFVDSDGIDLDKPVRLHVKIEKKGDHLLFDFTGCADQTKGPANIRPTIVRAACCYLLTCLVDPALAINYGLAQVHRHQSARRQRGQPASFRRR